MNVSMQQQEYFDTYRPITFRDIIRIVWRRKWLILGLVVGATGITAYITEKTPKVYRSEAKILLRWETPDVIVLTPNSRYTTRPARNEQLNSEVELIRSFEVAEKTFRLASERYEDELTPMDSIQILRIKKAVQARAMKNASIILISFEDQNPVRAAKMVNLIIQAYKAYRNELYARIDDFDFLREQIEANRKKLDALRRQLDAYRSGEEVVSIEAQKTRLTSQLTKIETDLFEVQRKRLRQETLLQEFKKLNLADGDPGGLPTSTGTADWSAARMLYNQLVQLYMRRARLLEKYTEEYDEVKAINEEIVSIRTMLEKELRRIYELEESALQAMRTEERILASKARSLREQIKKLPTVEYELNSLARDIQEYEKIHTMLLQRKEEKRMNAAKSLDELTIKILNPAMVPSKPVRPNVQANIGLAFVLSLLTGLGLAFLLEYSTQTIQQPEDVEEAVGLPVLATVKDLKHLHLNGAVNKNIFKKLSKNV